MILIPTSELEEGMVVAKEIRGQDQALLLRKGAQLSPTSIQLLQLLHVNGVYVDVEGTEDIQVEDIVSPEIRTECQRTIERAMNGFQRQAGARKLALDARMVEQATYGMVEELLSGKDTLVSMLDVRDWNNKLFQHSVNTAALATIIAKSLGHAEEDCKQLAMGMIFHDCGQMFLPQEVFDKKGRLSDTEREIVRKHARVGFQKTLRGSILSPISAYIVLRHHERMDGNGYPDRLPGEELHPLARIAAVVEAFDAMTSLRPYERSLMPDKAMREILSQAGTAFDRQVVLTLARHIAIYPTGSAVLLNTGECGIVAATPPGNTTRPTVRLLYGPDGRRLPFMNVDLSLDRDRWVIRSGISLAALRREQLRQAA